MNCETIAKDTWRQAVVRQDEYNRLFIQAAREVLNERLLDRVFDRADYLLKCRKGGM